MSVRKLRAEPSETDLLDDAQLLSVRNLRVTYGSGERRTVAVRDVDLDIRKGEILAVVGESGSGKSTLALAIAGMLPASATVESGEIRLGEHDILRFDDSRMRRLRGRDIGWIPQDPGVTLNPLRRIGPQAVEALISHRLIRREQEKDRAVSLLDRVGLSFPAQRVRQYPHELSGGMRQRVLIAGALATSPRLIIADEPTSALDVTVQKRILDDLERLAAAEGISVLIITHDLAVAAGRADRIVVFRQGAIVEQGTARSIIDTPTDPYTKALIASAPSIHARRPPKQPSFVPGHAPADDGPVRASLLVRNIVKDFATLDAAGGKRFRAVDDVSFSIEPGTTLGLVGESGSGKSTTVRIVLGLTKPTSGSVHFDGIDIHQARGEQRRHLRRLIQPVYQNPYASLNPRFSVEEIVAEPLLGFKLGNQQSSRTRARDLLDQVGLPRHLADRYPAELSGGQRQRVAIARALAPGPSIILCDEPVSALDVTIQAQVLNLLSDLQAEYGLSYLFISHDLAVVRQMADRIAVIQNGRIVEHEDADALFDAPRHPYTKLLLESVP